jgi:hypothetical protein
MTDRNADSNATVGPPPLSVRNITQQNRREREQAAKTVRNAVSNVAVGPSSFPGCFSSPPNSTRPSTMLFTYAIMINTVSYSDSHENDQHTLRKRPSSERCAARKVRPLFHDVHSIVGWLRSQGLAWLSGTFLALRRFLRSRRLRGLS